MPKDIPKEIPPELYEVYDIPARVIWLQRLTFYADVSLRKTSPRLN
jgi:hypothetical protein